MYNQQHKYITTTPPKKPSNLIEVYVDNFIGNTNNLTHSNL